MTSLLAQINIGDAFELSPGVGINRVSLYDHPGNLITILIRNAYMAGGLIIFGLLIFGGISYIVSVGSGNSKRTGQGAKAIRSALIGFLILFTSYWIIEIIQAILNVNILNNPILP